MQGLWQLFRSSLFLTVSVFWSYGKKLNPTAAFGQRTCDCAAVAGEDEDEDGYAALQLLGQEKQFKFKF